MKRLKILEICPFSAGICGVWTRVLGESKEFLDRGYGVEDVQVFSSDIIKGTHEYAESREKISGVSIKRFKSKSSILSANVKKFNFADELIKLRPNIVITHLFHPHSFTALAICRKLKIPCYLVTHAPFNVKRRFPLNLVSSFYNALKVKPKLNQFTKVIAITKWELPYLEKLGIKKDKIIHIPNGIPEEFFKQKKIKPKKDVLFLGRIAPVKNLEILLKTAKLLPEISFSIVGSAEKEYLEKLRIILKQENISNVTIYPPVYDINKKIKLIDEHRIFVLPSKREAMPQVLLEAMARNKLVIASKTDGAKEIIREGKTGFFFEMGDFKGLGNLIKSNLAGNNKIQKSAENEAKKYSWKSLIKLYPFIKK